LEEAGALGHALTEIRIIDATGRLIRAPETLFAAKEAGLEAFGWNFSNARLLQQFDLVAAKLASLTRRDLLVHRIDSGDSGYQVHLGDDTIVHAQLLVGADGKKSIVRAAGGFSARERAFEQAALVCDLQLARPIGGTSIELHYPNGPFTLVPAGGDRANLVWIDKLETLNAAKEAATEAFAAMLLERSQHLVGTVKVLTPTAVFPLSTLAVDRAGANGIVLVGEAAHAFPPIGAQGLNLGLRDVADLTGALSRADRSKADWAVFASEDYANRRAGDLVRTGGLVDTLFRSLLTEMMPAQAMRAGSLWALKLMPSLRRQAFALGMGVR
jgi:2-octaprenyl-6-methoxyphenol hydroxylase